MSSTIYPFIKSWLLLIYRKFSCLIGVLLFIWRIRLQKHPFTKEPADSRDCCCLSTYRLLFPSAHWASSRMKDCSSDADIQMQQVFNKIIGVKNWKGMNRKSTLEDTVTPTKGFWLSELASWVLYLLDYLKKKFKKEKKTLTAVYSLNTRFLHDIIFTSEQARSIDMKTQKEAR